MQTDIPYHKRCDSYMNFVVAKSSFEYFATKRVHKVRRSTSTVSKNVIYIAFCLRCLKHHLMLSRNLQSFTKYLRQSLVFM